MSNTDEYNGWTNRETWAVALHINNDRGWQRSVLDALREGPYASEGFTLEEARQAFYNAPRSIEHYAGDIIRENVRETLRGLAGGWGDSYEEAFNILSDIGSLWRVAWDELGAAFLSDLAEGDDA